MAWTNTQKQIAARACKAARLSDGQRRDVVLRHFDHARDASGRITSTAPRLTNADFEQFMAIVEAQAGGQVLHFSAGYWRDHAADRWARMRGRILRIAAALEAAGKLAPGGVGLAGWIEKRVTRGETNRIEQLDYHRLLALLLGLQAYAAQNGVALPDNTDDVPTGGERILHDATPTH